MSHDLGCTGKDPILCMRTTLVCLCVRSRVSVSWQPYFFLLALINFQQATDFFMCAQVNTDPLSLSSLSEKVRHWIHYPKVREVSFTIHFTTMQSISYLAIFHVSFHFTFASISFLFVSIHTVKVVRRTRRTCVRGRLHIL